MAVVKKVRKKTMVHKCEVHLIVLLSQNELKKIMLRYLLWCVIILTNGCCHFDLCLFAVLTTTVAVFICAVFGCGHFARVFQKRHVGSFNLVSYVRAGGVKKYHTGVQSTGNCGPEPGISYGGLGKNGCT